jgi:HPt (histidine-containing phosphotransfer) domain-containing protein
MSEGFEAIARQFRIRCAQDLKDLEAVLQRPAPIDWVHLRTIVHRLAGLAATFGFGELGQLAHEIDLELIRDRHPENRQIRELASALAAVNSPS